jgi:hypothetical protein
VRLDHLLSKEPLVFGLFVDARVLPSVLGEIAFTVPFPRRIRVLFWVLFENFIVSTSILFLLV